MSDGNPLSLVAPSLSVYRGQYQLESRHLDIRVDERSIDTKKVTTPKVKVVSDMFPLRRDGKPWLSVFKALQN